MKTTRNETESDTTFDSSGAGRLPGTAFPHGEARPLQGVRFINPRFSSSCEVVRLERFQGISGIAGEDSGLRIVSRSLYGFISPRMPFRQQRDGSPRDLPEAGPGKEERPEVESGVGDAETARMTLSARPVSPAVWFSSTSPGDEASTPRLARALVKRRRRAIAGRRRL